MKESFVLTEYQWNTGFPQRITLALVTDLHEHDPSQVLPLIRQAKPDLVLVAGDTFERHACGADPRSRKDYGMLARAAHGVLLWLDDLLGRPLAAVRGDPANAYRFIREAAKIAPVYMSLGNHEWYLEDEDRALLAETGTTLLDNQDCTVLVRGTTLRIGGLSSGMDLPWLERFAEKDGYKLLLCHHPEYYERYVRDKNIDLMLSGHAHGGQIRMFDHGIFSPGQGIWPKYTHGGYDGRLVVSAGCSNTASIPRWGNPCEVVVLHLSGSC